MENLLRGFVILLKILFWYAVLMLPFVLGWIFENVHILWLFVFHAAYYLGAANDPRNSEDG